MVRTRTRTAQEADKNPTSTGHATSLSSARSAIAQFLHGSLEATQQTNDWMVHLQHMYVDTTLSWGDILTSELKEIQKARDILQLFTTQSKAVDQQLDICAKQMSATMQQLYDAQMLWLGQWDKTVEKAESVDMAAIPEYSALAVWGKAQDEWLQLSQNWIDGMKSMNAVK